jgi:hypothetical protein
MANTLARIVSYLFHPLLMATYLFFLLSKALPSALMPIPATHHLLFIELVAMFTLVLPLIVGGILRTFGLIRSFHMVTRKERILPFILGACIYTALPVLFFINRRMDLDDNFLKLLIVVDLLVIVTAIVTFFIKVSVHSLSIWGMVGIILPLNKVAEVNTLFYPTIILILLSGIVMSARLQLDAHTPREVMLGGALGLATSVAGMFILFAS